MHENEANHQTANEAALLISCLRGQPFTVLQDLGWQVLLELAEAHGVLLLLDQAFRERHVQTPDFFATAVRKHLDVVARFAAELEELLKQLAKEGIEVLPLKGPVLAEALYGNVTMRSCDDLDLLVRREDFPRAGQLLLDLGFAARTAGDDYHRKFLREGVLVELHYGVASPRSFPFDLDGVWDRARSEQFRDQPMRVMSDGDLVLFLCLHGLKHGFSRLIWISDLARALESVRNDGAQELAKHAQRQGLEQALLIGCQIVREVLPQQLPSEMEALLAESPQAAERAQHAVKRLFSEGTGANNDPEIWGLYLQTEGSARQRWRRRLSFLMPTAGDYAWADRHRIYRGLMPAIRPFRLLHKYGASRAWRILFPPPV
jgi:putative nucleotidyltransferase-like protein